MLTAGSAILQSRPTPALILTYSIIDTMGWLSSRTTDETVRACFTRFLSDWVLKSEGWECTADDLYGARCALLHTMTGDSKLSRDGKAKRVAYVYGVQKTAAIEQVIASDSSERFAKVSIDRLIEAVKSGAAAFFVQAKRDEEMWSRLVVRSEKFYHILPFDGPAQHIRRGGLTRL